MTIRDNKDSIQVLLFSHYFTITSGDPPGFDGCRVFRVSFGIQTQGLRFGVESFIQIQGLGSGMLKGLFRFRR